MPTKRTGKSQNPKRRPTDVNLLARQLVRESTETVEAPVTKNDLSRVMAELGRRGGKLGGKKRAQALTPERRREIALKAARKRWDSASQS